MTSESNVHQPPSPESLAENTEDLATCEWYWGDVSQNEVRQIMAGLPDGYFLVRDASKSSSGDFTLALRISGENRLFRIYHRDESYSMNDPPDPMFHTLTELINYCQSRSDFELTPISHRYYGLRRLSDSIVGATTPEGHQSNIQDVLFRNRPSSNSATECDSQNEYMSIEQLHADRRETSKQLCECETQFRSLSHETEQIMQSRENAACMTKGNQKLLEWLEVQRERLEEHTSDTANKTPDQVVMTPDSPSDLSSQMDHIQKLIVETGDIINQTSQKFLTLSASYRAKSFEQTRSFFKQRELRRQVQVIRRVLKNNGVSFMEDDCEDTGLAMITDSSTWKLPQLPRDEAKQLLIDQPTGTFLIRFSDVQNCWVLSVS